MKAGKLNVTIKVDETRLRAGFDRLIAAQEAIRKMDLVDDRGRCEENAGLLAAIDAGDNVQAHAAILADWFEERGDYRGEALRRLLADDRRPLPVIHPRRGGKLFAWAESLTGAIEFKNQLKNRWHFTLAPAAIFREIGDSPYGEYRGDLLFGYATPADAWLDAAAAYRRVSASRGGEYFRHLTFFRPADLQTQRAVCGASAPLHTLRIAPPANTVRCIGCDAWRRRVVWGRFAKAVNKPDAVIFTADGAASFASILRRNLAFAAGRLANAPIGMLVTNIAWIESLKAAGFTIDECQAIVRENLAKATANGR